MKAKLAGLKEETPAGVLAECRSAGGFRVAACRASVRKVMKAEGGRTPCGVRPLFLAESHKRRRNPGVLRCAQDDEGFLLGSGYCRDRYAERRPVTKCMMIEMIANSSSRWMNRLETCMSKESSQAIEQTRTIARMRNMGTFFLDV